MWYGTSIGPKPTRKFNIRPPAVNLVREIQQKCRISLFSFMSYERGMRGQGRGLNPVGKEICPAAETDILDEIIKNFCYNVIM